MQNFQLKQVFLFLIYWILIALIFSGLLYFSSVQFNSNRTIYWKDIFMWQAIIYAWAILFPLISLFAKRFSLNRENWFKALPAHIIAGTVFILLHTTIYNLMGQIIDLIFSDYATPFSLLRVSLSVKNLALVLILYPLILAIIYLLDFYRRFPGKKRKLKILIFKFTSALIYDSAKENNQIVQRQPKYVSIVVLLLVPLCFGLLSLKLGQDTNWDLQNYHIYNPYAFLHGRINYDLAPAGLQTYFNPFVDVLYYQAITSLNARLVGFVLAVIHGLNFVVLYGIYKNTLKPFGLTDGFSLFLALTSVLTVGFLSEIGTSYHDNLILLFPLLSLLIITRGIKNIYNNNRNAVLAIMAAGIIVGFGAGLKLVIITFALAMCLSFFALDIQWISRFKFSIIFGLSVIVGLLMSEGYWFYLIWHNFGNPTFPQFNHIFHGSLATSEVIRDDRFLPKSMLDKIFYPIIFTLKPNRVSEIEYKQISWLILYVSLLIFFGNRLLSFFRRKPASRILTPEIRFIIIYFCLAYVFWLHIFGIYRYMIPIDVLIPLILFVIATYLFKSKLLRIAAVFFIGAITIVNLWGIANWGRAPWSDQVFHLDANDLREANPAAVFLVGQPTAWIIPALNPQAPVIQIAPNFPVSEAYWERARVLINMRSGKLYIILEAENQNAVDEANAGLSNMNLFVNTNSCVPLDAYLGTRKFKFRSCEVNNK